MKNRTQTKRFFGRMSCLPEENDNKTLSVSQLLKRRMKKLTDQSTRPLRSCFFARK